MAASELVKLGGMKGTADDTFSDQMPTTTLHGTDTAKREANVQKQRYLPHAQ